MHEFRGTADCKGPIPKDVACMLGVDRTTYAKYESGTSEPNYDMLLTLADIFEVSTDYLLGRTDQKNQPAPINEDELDDMERQLVSYVRRMTPEQKFLLLAQMQVLTGQEEALRLSQAGASVGTVTES